MPSAARPGSSRVRASRAYANICGNTAPASAIAVIASASRIQYSRTTAVAAAPATPATAVVTSRARRTGRRSDSHPTSVVTTSPATGETTRKSVTWNGLARTAALRNSARNGRDTAAETPTASAATPSGSSVRVARRRRNTTSTAMIGL
ncbi:hypothetical protein Prum_101470 [Phytohabitans rumicis]|uniref:Uncharacterized protein n=1 Tax=Phytohabitans rumicis TaxID=1076125 RepID=A0A6V8LUQ6_9ACTN|nr:hypothetical protein Prum_101470 [Phytohabitans rumicis]